MKTKILSCNDLIIGSGIIGLSIAYELINKNPHEKIIIIEKESQIGLHASGRNSGVLHSGIYYPEGSLKARVCLEGSNLMKQFCIEHQLPINQLGKIVVPTKESDSDNLSTIFHRAKANGATIHLIDERELKKIEPDARTATGTAMVVPETAVIDPQAIMQQLLSILLQKGVTIYYNTPCEEINTECKKIKTHLGEISYGHLFNCAGGFADKIAQQCGVASEYTLLPFKGLYHQLSPTSPISINHLIYLVPDMNMPFLGVHFTKSIFGKTYIGPNAIPALGRENYRQLKGVNASDLVTILSSLVRQYYSNKQGFRHYTHQEIPRIFKSQFIKSAKLLVPNVQSKDIIPKSKVGIRPQLYNMKKHELVMDFIIEQSNHETHVLNAISPAFTSAFSLAKLITSTH